MSTKLGQPQYDLIPNMCENDLMTLMTPFHDVAQENEVFKMVFGMEE